MTSKWNKEDDYDYKIVWRNKKDPSITVEAHRGENRDLSGDDDDTGYFWYAFTAKDGRGIESSPYTEDSKKEIISVVAQLKEDFEESQ